MNIIKKETYIDMSQAVARVIIDVIKENSKLVLGLATGSTPLELYKELINAYEKGEVSFKDVITFNLDEYVGLEQSHSQSYYYFMQENLFSKTDFQRSNIHLPSGTAEDLGAAAVEYEKSIIEAGGIDLQVLGIGGNGHIAFNEPGSSFDSVTRVVDLTVNTIEANARFFDSADEVPKKAVTMGLATIMSAKKIVLLATGQGKAEIIKTSLQGEVNEDVPASILQKHNDVDIFLDKEAASQL